MHLTHLSLSQYRNYARLELDLGARVHLFCGDNAQGKTNLLEAISYLSTTRSQLTSLDRELIRWEALEDVIPSARVAVTYRRGGEEHDIDVALVLDRENGPDTPPTRYRRSIQVDGMSRRSMDVVGNLNTVLFLPQDIGLVTGSPGNRRRYLDITLCQIDRSYCRALSRYNRIVSQRNALLRQGRPSDAQLAYWDEQLIAQGAAVLARRVEAVHQMDGLAANAHAALTGGTERLALRYMPSLDDLTTGETPLTSDIAGELGVAGLSAHFARALRAARADERRRGVTLLGPHRDDLRFFINGIDAIVYGSRGQQRTAALALKLGEVALMRAETGESPVLLLDDILSELDEVRGRHVLDTVAEAEQVLVTTTDLRGFTPAFLANTELWRVSQGTVVPDRRHG